VRFIKIITICKKFDDLVLLYYLYGEKKIAKNIACSTCDLSKCEVCVGIM